MSFLFLVSTLVFWMKSCRPYDELPIRYSYNSKANKPSHQRHNLRPPPPATCPLHTTHPPPQLRPSLPPHPLLFRHLTVHPPSLRPTHHPWGSPRPLQSWGHANERDVRSLRLANPAVHPSAHFLRLPCHFPPSRKPRCPLRRYNFDEGREQV